jgi:hypothetical protein
MARNDDDNGMKYKEGVDFEVVDKGGYKTRRFFTKAEKEAMKNPKPAPKKAAPKKAAPKLKGIKTIPITTSPLPEDTADKTMKLLGKTSVGGPMPDVDVMGNATGMKRGGKVAMKEGSAKDMREDKAMAKKRGMTMKAWEKSAADKKHDAPKKMMSGGVVKKATGGSMRGAGCAVRGKGFSGSY